MRRHTSHVRITRTHVNPNEIEAFVRNIQHRDRKGWYRRDWKLRPDAGIIAKDSAWKLVVGYKPNTGYYYARIGA